MPAWIWALPPAVFALAWGLTRYLATPGSLGYVLDRPNARSMHERPTPRSGGLGFLLPLLVSGLAYAALDLLPWAWLAGLALLAGVSWRDDRAHLPVRRRLAAQGLAAAALLWDQAGVLAGLWPDLSLAVAAPLAWLAVVWLINLYNFMDGMDGFAGGMAVLGFAALGLAGAWVGAPAYALFWALAAAAVAGFLLLNLPPARIFMGDVGSASLGFCVALAALWGEGEGIAWTVPALVFSPFWVDATLTLVKRGLAGQRVWEAHAEHYYQRVVRAGWDQRRVLAGEYALMLVSAAAGLAALHRPEALPALGLGLGLVYAGLLGLCHRRWLHVST